MSARSAPVRVAVYLIELYRHTISPLRLPTCRFTPTCSQYAVDALSEYGLLRGGWLALVRLGKCGPWHNGGWDPIPDRDGQPDDHSEAPGPYRAGVTEHRASPDHQGKSQPRV